MNPLSLLGLLLAQARIAGFHSAMHLLAMILPGEDSAAAVGALGRRVSRCAARLPLVPTLCCLLPLLPAPAPARLCWHDGGAAAGGHRARAPVRRLCVFCVHHLRAVPAAAAADPHRAASSLRAWEERRAARRGSAATALEAGIRQLCRRSLLAPAPDQRAAAAAEAEEAALLPRGGPPSTPQLHGWQRGVAWWFLLALTWAAAVEVHGWDARPTT